VVLVYALAISVLSINAGFTLLYVTNELMDRPTYINSMRYPIMGFYSSPDSVFYYSAYFVTLLLSFILTWFATVLILRHYSKRLGKIKYWIIVSIPLIYFLSQFQPIFLNVFAAYRLSEPFIFGIVYILIFTASKPAGGILFGIAFWSISKGIRRRTIRNYMFISAYGIMLLFTSNQSIVLVSASYPPFGLATISFMGLSSYLILVGIYSAAISVAQDVNLRKSIRKIVEQQSNLLDNIGTSQMEQEVRRKVVKVMKDLSYQTEEKTGIQTSFEEQDIKEYLNKVIEEVKEKRKQ
jgi:hypothetical protein